MKKMRRLWTWIMGCALMLLAVVLAQLPARGKVAEAAKN